MSEERVKVVRRLIDLPNENDWDGIPEFVSPDFEWHTPGGAIGSARVYVGVEGTREWRNSQVAQGWDLDQSYDEVEEAHDLGNVVAAVIRSVDVGASSRIEVESRSGGLFEFDGETLIRTRVFLGPEDAFKAAGFQAGG